MKSSAVFVVLFRLCYSSKLAGKQSPPDPEHVTLPQVPAVQNIGESGYPELPTLESIMSGSSKTLSGISSEARELEAKMLRVQNENKLRLKRQKAVFDRKLKEQEEKNQAVVKENALTAKSILAMKKENEQLAKAAHDLEQGNAIRRTELSKIQEQLSQLQKFLKETEEQSDDSQAPELEIMHSKPHAHREDAETQPKQELSTELSISESSEGLSFLSLMSEVDAPTDELASPEGDASAEKEMPAGKDAVADKDASNLIDVLAEGVSDMKNEGQKSEAQLKQLFMSHFEQGVKRHKALESQQRVLKNTMTKMNSFEARMQNAIKKLEGTKTLLDKRLHDAGNFLQKLAQITLSKPEEAYLAFDSKHDL